MSLRIKKQVIALWETRFEESLEERCNCPECKGKKCLSRRIVKEPEQKWAGRWYVEYCMNDECPYWDCGFLPKRYRPRNIVERNHQKKKTKNKRT